MSWTSWAILDSLYCPEQYPFSHLDSYGHYIAEYSSSNLMQRICLNQPAINTGHAAWAPAYNTVETDRMYRNGMGLGNEPYDIALWLDGYHRWAEVPAKKRIAQVAALTNPMPWDVRKGDGSPVFSLIISSIPAMVDAARAAGCNATYMPLAFDLRARVCMMGVKRDINCLFIGTTGGNHVRRTQLLEELKDEVTILPPTFGADYFKTLARAKVVLNVHSEWAQGAANAMRLFEAAGMGCEVVSDGEWPSGAADRWWFEPKDDDPESWREAIHTARVFGSEGPADVLLNHTYECADRIPRLVELVRGL